MNPLIQLKEAIRVSLVVLACFALLPAAQALLPPPPPDGGYSNRNTAEGDFALFSADVEAANDNTAIGFTALFNNIGSENTAIGSGALLIATQAASTTRPPGCSRLIAT